MLEQRPVQPTLCCFGSEAPAPQQCVHGWLCPDSSRSISVVTAPVPTDTWSRHSPPAGLVPGAGPSQLVHNHQEGLCHDGTVSVLGRWMQGAVLTVSRAEARPRLRNTGWTCQECQEWVPDRESYVSHMKKSHGRVSVACAGPSDCPARSEPPPWHDPLWFLVPWAWWAAQILSSRGILLSVCLL